MRRRKFDGRNRTMSSVPPEWSEWRGRESKVSRARKKDDDDGNDDGDYNWNGERRRRSRGGKKMTTSRLWSTVWEGSLARGWRRRM